MSGRRIAMSLALLCAAASPAFAGASCLQHRAGCQAVCGPERVARYYFGSYVRCTASCEPRFQQCVRSGVWADLERLSTGWYEPAAPF